MLQSRIKAHHDVSSPHMTELFEYQALLALSLEGRPCFIDPCAIDVSAKNAKTRQKMREIR